ncbi:hypothetical protein COCC4DRAFT_30019 [Bipolaris maydis ATCC 48331]|uniref:Uncharacterized protein n=2 Tax=Cochliobolus heterostrophus TaxID=5016 RepID=M2UAE3_COCH5|nr:uncharacterized protein COCC4DRAFT_30019 [Bipolaris maydis ATCC 48331]EMD90696.1 hypothetical protein COCHEDRAFT_1022488 [Bipolaris maydis C5]ENI09093.1 hypothetical protein COCC4DRAFT_30019 [Bipolaris maydis ATCC 48331]
MTESKFDAYCEDALHWSMLAPWSLSKAKKGGAQGGTMAPSDISPRLCHGVLVRRRLGRL